MNPDLWQAIEAFVARFYGGRRLLITPFGYPVQFTSVANGASQSQVVNIAANADFVLIGVRHRTRLAAAGQTVSTKPAPIARLLLIDSGSNEQFTQSAVDLENYGSNDAKIVNLCYPRVIAGRTTITATLSNYAPAAETINTEVFLDGVQVRAYSGQ
jgi:hypothetical protein